VNETGEISSEVLDAARNLFYQRTRTLYRCAFPTIKKSQLDILVKDDWSTAPDSERNMHIMEVVYPERTFSVA
jgi:hypothetical protein